MTPMPDKHSQPPLQGQLLRRSNRREAAIFLRNGQLWVADFIDGDGQIVDAVTWFRFHCAGHSSLQAQRRMVRESGMPLSPELVERIERLHGPLAPVRKSSALTRVIAAIAARCLPGRMARAVIALICRTRDRAPAQASALPIGGTSTTDRACAPSSRQEPQPARESGSARNAANVGATGMLLSIVLCLAPVSLHKHHAADDALARSLDAPSNDVTTDAAIGWIGAAILVAPGAYLSCAAMSDMVDLRSGCDPAMLERDAAGKSPGAAAD